MSKALKVVQTPLFPEEKLWEFNTIARAEWHVSSPFTEQIVVRLIHELQETGKLEDKELTVRDIVGYHATKREYEAARDLSKTIRGDYVHIPYENGDFADYNIFRGRIYYSAKKQTLKISLNPDIIGFYKVLANSSHFTVIGWTEFLELKDSHYTQRLYHNLMSWQPHTKKDTAYWEVEVDELRRLLGATAKVYQNLTMFKQLLGRSLEKINTKTSLDVSWEIGKKEGRRVKTIRFLYHSYQPINYAPKKRVKQ